MLNRDALVAPSADGGVLIEPSAAELPRLSEASQAIFRDARMRILGRDLHEVRVETRSRVAGATDGPVWVVGHQPEFMHAGVWFKHVVADRLARRTGGVAVNLIVDNDEPKTTRLRLIARGGERPRVDGIDVPSAHAGCPFEQWPAMSAEEIARFREDVRARFGPAFDPSMMPAVVDGFGDAGAEGGFVGQMIAGRRRIDAVAGIQMVERRVSEVWGGPLLGQMLLDADRFASDYNTAVAAYRRTHNIKGRTRPVPDLARDGLRIELPLWIVPRDGARQRLFVAPHGDAIALYAHEALVATLKTREIQHWCASGVAAVPGTAYAIRPRALSLTLWARLVLGDVFIHGIGGAKYDEMTDALMHRYFGIEPPPMVCASATLRLFDAADVSSEDDVRRAARQLREWKYNPHRVDGAPPAVGSMLPDRDALIARSKHLRDRSPSEHDQRRQVFEAIRAANASMRARLPISEDELRKRLTAAEYNARDACELQSREFFVGLFTQERIASLAAEGDARLRT